MKPEEDNLGAILSLVERLLSSVNVSNRGNFGVYVMSLVKRKLIHCPFLAGSF